MSLITSGFFRGAHLLRGHRPPLALWPLLFAILLIAVACDDEDPANGNGGGDATTSTPPAATATEPSTPEATPGGGTPTPSGTAGAGVAAQLPEEPRLGLELVAEGLTAPVDFAEPDDGTGRLFVVEQTGTIRIVGEDGQLMGEPFLDVTDRMVGLQEGYTERGLLGLAFHPDYAENGRFFVYYSAPLAEGAPDGWDHTSHLSEFTVSADNENAADPQSERIIMQVDEPQRNHNGGHITFGLDGYLYIPLGDGGGGDDTAMGHTPDIGNGQDRTNILGSILRIDVDSEGEGGQPYAIPQDNPWVDDADTPPEIWANGLRNPYDISVDPEGEFGILISDAGQELFEEVSLAFGGENFGWHIMEGTHCFDPEAPEEPLETCPSEGPNGNPLVGPVVEYHRADFGTVISGAQLYRGEALSDYQGLMFFVDWNTGGQAAGGIFVAAPNDNLDATDVDEGLWEFAQVEVTTQLEGSTGQELGRYITGLVTDVDNELYILVNRATGPEQGAGEVYRLVPADEGGN